MVGDKNIGLDELLHNMRTTYNMYVEELQAPFQRVAREDAFADGVIAYLTAEVVKELEKKRDFYLKPAHTRLYGICDTLNSKTCGCDHRARNQTLLLLYETHLLKIKHVFSRIGFWWFSDLRKNDSQDIWNLLDCGIFAEEERKEVIRMWYDIRIMFLNKIIELYESK